MAKGQVLAVSWDNEEICFRELNGWLERLRGLLGTGPCAVPVALVRCRSIHTFGMSYALDVALVDKDNRVLVSRRGMPSRCVLGSHRACCAFERPASEDPWPEVGTCLSVKRCEETLLKGANDGPTGKETC